MTATLMELYVTRIINTEKGRVMLNEKKSLEQVSDLLRPVAEGFFAEGEVHFESAYACVALASIYVDRLLGEDEHNGLIEIYESRPMSVPTMYSSDIAIQKQIDHLQALLDMLRKADPPRHQLVMAPWERSNS